uniref:Uncharacterized protein n=1 Tax=Anguilla anguilla TaxID=7936 RepID=A0A0E9VKP2_ANGAN
MPRCPRPPRPRSETPS